jgi:hypothetical protein
MASTSVQPCSRLHTPTRQGLPEEGQDTGDVTQPVSGAHASRVQGLPSSHERGAPTHTPDWQRPFS